MSPMAIQKNIKMYLDTDQPAVLLNADSEEIEIIMNNLISNAVKYNKDNGTVNCVIRSDGDKIKISVQDTGIGMTEDDISKLFQYHLYYMYNYW